MWKWIGDCFAKLFGQAVRKEVCAEIQKRNELAHNYLDDYIKTAMDKCQESFADLKNDMQRGFDEVKQLIKDRI